MLNTEKMEKVIEKFGGNPKDLKTNLESERLDVLMNMEGGSGGGGKYAPRYIRFTNYTGTELDNELANLDTSNLVSGAMVFSGLSSLTNLDLSSWNTSNITTMSSMFYNSPSLINLNLRGWKISKVTDFIGFCSGASKLENIDLSTFTNGLNVTSVKAMFKNCSSLKRIDLNNFVTDTKLTDISNMFSGCTSLEFIDIRNMNLWTHVTSYSDFLTNVPKTCTIVTKSKSFLSSRFSGYNYMTVAEYEASLTEE